MSNVLPFAPVSPIRFTPETRQAINALGYSLPGVNVEFEACEDGDQWAALVSPDKGTWFTVVPDRRGLLTIKRHADVVATCEAADISATLTRMVLAGPPVKQDMSGLIDIAMQTLDEPAQERLRAAMARQASGSLATA